MWTLHAQKWIDNLNIVCTLNQARENLYNSHQQIKKLVQERNNETRNVNTLRPNALTWKPSSAIKNWRNSQEIEK